MKSLLKLKDVAKLLDCSLSNVYALVSEGKLPVLRVGLKKGLRVDEADFLAYLAKVRHEGAGAAPRRPSGTFAFRAGCPERRTAQVLGLLGQVRVVLVDHPRRR